MTDLLALAERCEKATRPDRELDAEIAYALGWKTEMFGGAGKVWRDPSGKFPVAVQPNYSSSIDAALTLVPEGAEADVTFGRPGTSRAAIFIGPSKPGDTGDAMGFARTPALALTAAALRARAALTK